MNQEIKVRVSIIIPTYNDAIHIENAIKSIFNQSFKDFEVILIDDGSTDNTKDVLESYIKSNSIIYLYQNNKRQSFAKNNGISIARGEYIAFLDSDDEWIDKDKLKIQVEFLDKNPEYILVGTNGIVIDENKNKIMDYTVPETDLLIRKSILLKNPFIQSSVVIRKDILNKAGLFLVTEHINAEDYNLWLRVGLLGKLYNLKNPMTMYMVREGNHSLNNKKNILKNNIPLIKEYKNKYPNYKKALIITYLKYVIYSLLKLIKNKKIRDKIINFLYKKYRGLDLVFY